MIQSKLIPLRIPKNWSVIYNSFYDDSDFILDENGEIDNNLSFTEDVLNIREIYFHNNEFKVKEDGFSIFLGWYPDSNPTGQYKLELIKKDFSHTLLTLHSRDKKWIAEAVEICLEEITYHGFNQEKILSLIK
jgi:hypothetical protein